MFQHSAPSPAWLQHDMERVDAIIRAHMNNDVALIRQVVEFILHGAERQRPALVLATARALGHGGERPHALAAAVELIHISLALHDDVTEASGGAADGAHEAALFGNAGNILLGDLLYTSAFRMIVDLDDMEVMRATFETNNLGLAATFQPFVRAFCERRSGTLVGIASVAGIRGLPGHGAYCSSKAAVISYCESLRGECRPFGVKVVTLSPGYIDTPLTRDNRYPMPFLMSPAAFAERAVDAIEQGASYRVIPWQMGIVAGFLRVLPNAWLDRVLAGQPRKHRKPKSIG